MGATSEVGFQKDRHFQLARSFSFWWEPAAMS